MDAHYPLFIFYFSFFFLISEVPWLSSEKGYSKTFHVSQVRSPISSPLTSAENFCSLQAFLINRMKVGYKDNFKAVRNVEDNLVYLLNVQIKETKDYSLIPQVK